MTRWLNRLRAGEKNTETLPPGAVKTVETSSDGVSTVLKAPDRAGSTIFSAAEQELRAPTKSSAWDTDEDRHLVIEERAAVLEHDGGLPRAEAEALAREQAVSEPAIVAAAAKVEDEGSPELATAAEPGGCALSVNAPLRHLATFMPVSGPGVTVGPPAVEVSRDEYDRHLDALIAAVGACTAEAAVLAFKKRKGHVVPRGDGTIYVKGRL